MIHARLIISHEAGIEAHLREDPHMGVIYAWAMNHVIDAGHKLTSVTHAVSADTGGTTTTFWVEGTNAAAARLFHNNP
jgi:hypothetical protein